MFFSLYHGRSSLNHHWGDVFCFFKESPSIVIVLYEYNPIHKSYGAGEGKLQGTTTRLEKYTRIVPCLNFQGYFFDWLGILSKLHSCRRVVLQHQVKIVFEKRKSNEDSKRTFGHFENLIFVVPTDLNFRIFSWICRAY